MSGLRKMGASSPLIQMDSVFEASMALPRSVRCVRESIFVCTFATASRSSEDLLHRLQRCIALRCQNCGAQWDSASGDTLRKAATLLNTQCGIHKSPIILENL